MKSTRAVIIMVAILFAATTAFGQRGRGPVGGTSGPGGMGTGADGMGSMSLLVAPDGTVVTSSVAFNSTANSAVSSVVGVNASGTTSWRWTAPQVVHRLDLANNLVLVSTGMMQSGDTTTSRTSELTALSLSDGKVAWKVTLPGIAMAIEPASTQIYVLVTQPQATNQGGRMGSGMGEGHHAAPPGSGTGSGSGMMAGRRTLVAVANSGVVLWSLDLE